MRRQRIIYIYLSKAGSFKAVKSRNDKADADDHWVCYSVDVLFCRLCNSNKNRRWDRIYIVELFKNTQYHRRRNERMERNEREMIQDRSNTKLKVVVAKENYSRKVKVTPLQFRSKLYVPRIAEILVLPPISEKWISEISPILRDHRCQLWGRGRGYPKKAISSFF